ncbi:hypothetical protein [Sodalis sp. dw_96]|nr:hypothetical protein [Sodalis sp. dw_96]
MFRLKPYRSQAKGVGDLLAYAALWHDGVVMTKSGGLIGNDEDTKNGS